MAGNISISTGVETPAQSRTSVSGGFSLPARPAPMPAPAGYQLMYQMGGPRYMYGETPRYGAYYSDGGTVPGQIYGNMRGSREGADMFGFWPTMFQSQPYATASQMYTPSLGVMPLIGYPSRYPHVIMGGYTDYGAPIANQAMNMMLPLLMMGLYRQMFPMPGAAPAAGAGAGGGKKGGGGSGGSGGKKEWAVTKEGYKFHYPGAEADWDGYASPSTANVPGWGGRVDTVGPMPASPADVVRDIRVRDARALADAGALAGAAAGAAFRGSAPAAPVVSAPPAAPRAVDNPVATPAIMRDPLADSGGVGSPSSGGKEQVQRLVDRFNVKNWYNPNF